MYFGNQIALVTRKLIGTTTRFDTKEFVVSLTFDDGPHPLYTPKVLSILEDFGVYANFFMVGKAAKSHPDIVQMVSRAGHSVCNHSWDHKSFPTITAKEQRYQIRECARVLSPYGRQRIFRPPWGRENLKSHINAFYLRYKVFAWDLEIGDWKDQSSQSMANQLISRVQPGSVILLHDSVYNKPDVGRENMLEALYLFLKRVDKEVHFKTLPEMLKFGRPVKRIKLCL